MIMPSAPVATTRRMTSFVGHAPGPDHKSLLVQPFHQFSIQEVGVGAYLGEPHLPGLFNHRLIDLARQQARGYLRSIGPGLLQTLFLEGDDGHAVWPAIPSDQVYGPFRQVQGLPFDLDVEVEPALVAFQQLSQGRNWFCAEPGREL